MVTAWHDSMNMAVMAEPAYITITEMPDLGTDVAQLGLMGMR